MSVEVRSIYEEGIRFPPVKLYDAGKLNRPLVSVLARNSRAPEAAVADVMALCTATAVGEQRILELCERFGRATYLAACDALLERTRRAVQRLIVEKIPEAPQSFEDFVDDDGQGNGPFRIKLTVWREGERAVFDFGRDIAAGPGPDQLLPPRGDDEDGDRGLPDHGLRPRDPLQRGFLRPARHPSRGGTILKPRYPAPLGNRHHTLSRWVEVVAGALGRHVPETAVAAGYGSSPHMIFSGTDSAEAEFGVVEILMGGIPGRPAGDGMDGHSWYPQLENTPCEYQEIYYPLVTEEVGHRPRLRRRRFPSRRLRRPEGLPVPRWQDRCRSTTTATPPGRGASAAAPGGRSRKRLARADGTVSELPGKIDFVEVAPGDRLIFETAGAGGWGDPLLRPAEAVRVDVGRGFVSARPRRTVQRRSRRRRQRLPRRRGRHRPTSPRRSLGDRRSRSSTSGPGPSPTQRRSRIPRSRRSAPSRSIEPRPIDAGLLDSRE